MSVTIKDVASFANVAPSTVSRVIADNPRISEKTKIRVREAMSELGYYPNFIARSLANQSTQILGVVLPSSADSHFQSPNLPYLMRGLNEAAELAKYSLLMITAQTEKGIYERVVDMVQGGMVDGLVLTYANVNDSVITYLCNRNFPFVLIGKPYEENDRISYVDMNYYEASYKITEYLLNLGHSKITFFGGNIQSVTNHYQLLGYEDCLKEKGIILNNHYIIHANYNSEQARGKLKELLFSSERPSALIVADDLQALSIATYLQGIGLSVPSDVSIASFNHTIYSELALPTFTSADINFDELGFMAMKSVIKQIKTPSDPIVKKLLPCTLNIRHSCKCFTEQALASSS